MVIFTLLKSDLQLCDLWYISFGHTCVQQHVPEMEFIQEKIKVVSQPSKSCSSCLYPTRNIPNIILCSVYYTRVVIPITAPCSCSISAIAYMWCPHYTWLFSNEEIRAVTRPITLPFPAKCPLLLYTMQIPALRHKLLDLF